MKTLRTILGIVVLGLTVLAVTGCGDTSSETVKADMNSAATKEAGPEGKGRPVPTAGIND